MSRSVRRPCLAPGCERKAKVLDAPYPGDRTKVYAKATKEPAFCTVRCAANWALLYAVDNLYCEDASGWCDRHGWYGYVQQEGECPECIGERERDAATEADENEG